MDLQLSLEFLPVPCQHIHSSDNRIIMHSRDGVRDHYQYYSTLQQIHTCKQEGFNSTNQYQSQVSQDQNESTGENLLLFRSQDHHWRLLSGIQGSITNKQLKKDSSIHSVQQLDIQPVIGEGGIARTPQNPKSIHILMLKKGWRTLETITNFEYMGNNLDLNNLPHILRYSTLLTIFLLG